MIIPVIHCHFQLWLLLCLSLIDSFFWEWDIYCAQIFKVSVRKNNRPPTLGHNHSACNRLESSCLLNYLQKKPVSSLNLTNYMANFYQVQRYLQPLYAQQLFTLMTWCEIKQWKMTALENQWNKKELNSNNTEEKRYRDVLEINSHLLCAFLLNIS